MLRKYLLILVITLAALAGSWIVAYSTVWGPVVYSDAAGYLTAARNFLAGRGLGVQEASGDFKLLTVHLPLYPVLLALISMMGMSVVEAARWLNVILYGLTVLTSGLTLFAVTGSALLAFSACGILLTSPLVLSVFSLAMSDALFTFTSLSGIYALMLFCLYRQPGWLIVSSMLLGICSATRYIGVAFILAGVIGVAFFTWLPIRRRQGFALLFGLLTSLPLLAWLGWTALQPQTEAPREMDTAVNLWQSLAPARLALVDIFFSWLPFAEQLPAVSYRGKLLALILVGGALFGLVLWAVWKHLSQANAAEKQSGIWQVVSLRLSAVGITVLCLAAVLASVLISYAYARPQLDLDNRTLFPIFLLGILLFLFLCDFFARSWPNQRWLSWLPVVGLLTFAVAGAPVSLEMVSHYHQDGAGYTGRKWQDSGVIQALRDLPADRAIVSNEPAAVLFLTGRAAYDLVEVYQAEPLAVYTHFGDQAADPAQVVFREQGAALALFNNLRWQLDRLYHEDTPARLEALTDGLINQGDYWDGAIYFYPGR